MLYRIRNRFNAYKCFNGSRFYYSTEVNENTISVKKEDAQSLLFLKGPLDILIVCNDDGTPYEAGLGV